MLKPIAVIALEVVSWYTKTIPEKGDIVRNTLWLKSTNGAELMAIKHGKYA